MHLMILFVYTYTPTLKYEYILWYIRSKKFGRGPISQRLHEREIFWRRNILKYAYDSFYSYLFFG